MYNNTLICDKEYDDLIMQASNFSASVADFAKKMQGVIDYYESKAKEHLEFNEERAQILSRRARTLDNLCASMNTTQRACTGLQESLNLIRNILSQEL